MGCFRAKTSIDRCGSITLSQADGYLSRRPNLATPPVYVPTLLADFPRHTRHCPAAR